MEEKMLKPKRYNVIQRIQKRLLIRSLKNHKNFDDWRKSKLKDDLEVMEIAWEFASNEQYKEFPVGMQIKMAQSSYNYEIIAYLSLEAQIKLFQLNPNSFIDYLSDEALQIVIKDNPDNWSNLSYRKKDILLEKEDLIKEIISKLTDNEQKEIVSKKSHFILSCSKETRESILRFKNLLSPEWQAILSKEENLSLAKLVKYMNYTRGSSSDISNQKVIANFCNSTEDKEELIKYLNEKGITKENDEFFTQLHMQKLFDKDTEMALFDELVEMYHRRRKICKPMVFRSQCMHEKLLNKENGLFLHSEYKEILEGISNGSYAEAIADRVFDLLFREKTIIEKVEPKKVIEYISLLDKYEKQKKKQNDVLIDKIPTSQKILEKKLNAKFAEIIKDAFGEKASNIIKNRPGIDLRDITNTEVFSPNIIQNFRTGFVNDLLSYNIAGLEDFILLAQKPEEIKAFKFYYDIMSKKLGENVVTMQLCISNYSKFQDVLKEASNMELTQQQIINIENLCSWPTNICNIKGVDELENLEERLQKEISKRNLQDMLDDNVFSENIKGEEILYDYKNLSEEELDILTEEEKATFRFLQQQSTIDICNINTLVEAQKNEIPLSSIFINQYLSRKKIKEHQMEKFNQEITNKEKIEDAASNGKDGVKIVNIDGVEIIDLGSMPVKFLSHYPKMRNSADISNDISLDSFMTTDRQASISTISTMHLNWEKGSPSGGEYIFWDLSSNEIIARSSHDASVAHEKRLVVSNGNSDLKIKNYKKENIELGEVAFYRRKRDHSKEEGMYAGKFAPDAILGIDEEKIIASQTRFGKPIPIIVDRKSLSNPETVKKYREIIQKAKEKIQKMQEEEKRQEDENGR